MTERRDAEKDSAFVPLERMIQTNGHTEHLEYDPRWPPYVAGFKNSSLPLRFTIFL